MLTLKRQFFVQEYLIDLNATQAAIRAGYSRRTAKQIAWELLRVPEVRAAIREANRARLATLNHLLWAR
jgi:phage terminase small subunit